MQELGEALSYTELVEWQIYDGHRPIGVERDDLMAAHICQVLVNLNRGKNKPAYKLKDFLLFKEWPKSGAGTKQSPEQLKQILMSMVSPKERKKHGTNDRRTGREVKTGKRAISSGGKG